jgi:uncharacterized UPF0146 family protein
LLFFFVNLGANLNLSIIGDQVVAALVFSVFVLIGNPIIVMIIMGAMGYRKRTSFLAGLTVAQISEFSLIFAGLGLAVGHITEETVGLITLVGLITIGLSTYFILYSHQIYGFLSPFLSIFQKKNIENQNELILDKNTAYKIVIIGLGRFGKVISEMLDEHKEIKYLGIDFDPSIIEFMKSKNGNDNIIYGDLEDPELFDNIILSENSIVISTIPNVELSLHLIKIIEKNNYNCSLFLTVINDSDFSQLVKNGFETNKILQPQKIAALDFYNNYLSETTTWEEAKKILSEEGITREDVIEYLKGYWEEQQ